MLEGVAEQFVHNLAERDGLGQVHAQGVAVQVHLDPAGIGTVYLHLQLSQALQVDVQFHVREILALVQDLVQQGHGPDAAFALRDQAVEVGVLHHAGL